jgi:hypothetical protein
MLFEDLNSECVSKKLCYSFRPLKFGKPKRILCDIRKSYVSPSCKNVRWVLTTLTVLSVRIGFETANLGHPYTASNWLPPRNLTENQVFSLHSHILLPNGNSRSRKKNAFLIPTLMGVLPVSHIFHNQCCQISQFRVLNSTSFVRLSISLHISVCSRPRPTD